MRKTIIAGVAGVAIAVIPALPATAASTWSAGATGTAGSTSTGCPTGNLPGYLAGAPAVKGGDPAGFYIWHTSTGWRLVVTHPGSSRVVFTGTVTATAPISYRPIRLERGDLVRLSADHRTLAFRFTDYGHLDGVALDAHCAKYVRFALDIDGHRASPARVYLGSREVRPTSNPFVVERRG